MIWQFFEFIWSFISGDGAVYLSEIDKNLKSLELGYEVILNELNDELAYDQTTLNDDLKKLIQNTTQYLDAFKIIELTTEEDWKWLEQRNQQHWNEQYSPLYSEFNVKYENMVDNLINSSIAATRELTTSVEALLTSEHAGDMYNIFRIMRASDPFKNVSIVDDLNNLIIESPHWPKKQKYNGENFFGIMQYRHLIDGNRSIDDPKSMHHEIKILTNFINSKINK